MASQPADSPPNTAFCATKSTLCNFRVAKMLVPPRIRTFCYCRQKEVHARGHPLSRASISLSNLRFLEHPIGGASIAANISNVRLLEHSMGASIIATFGSPSRPGQAWTRGGARSLENGEGRPNGQDGVQPCLLSPAGPGLGCLSEQNDLCKCRNLTSVPCLAPNQPISHPSDTTLSQTNCLENAAPAS